MVAVAEFAVVVAEVRLELALGLVAVARCELELAPAAAVGLVLMVADYRGRAAGSAVATRLVLVFAAVVLGSVLAVGRQLLLESVMASGLAWLAVAGQLALVQASVRALGLVQVLAAVMASQLSAVAGLGIDQKLLDSSSPRP